MELIYADSSGNEQGVIHAVSADIAFGYDENDFTFKVPLSEHVADYGYYLYLIDPKHDSGEFGGVVDKITIDTEANEVSYYGRTWHGILQNRVLQPESKQDYYIVSGDANEVLRAIVSKLSLGNVFSVATASSGITVKNYQFERYVDAYDGIRSMLGTYSAKLSMRYDRSAKRCILSAVKTVDYSINEPIDSDGVNFTATKNNRPVNHLVCGGSGELKDRVIVHLYADANGNVSQKKTFSGVNEIEEFYDASNADEENLIKNGTDRLKDYQDSSEIEVSLNPSEREYDIGDIIKASDRKSGISVTTAISKKLVTFEDGVISIEYEVGEGYTNSQLKQLRKSADNASDAVRKSDAESAAALIAANSKRRVFISQPVPPYDVGDLWVREVNGRYTIYYCKTAKED